MNILAAHIYRQTIVQMCFQYFNAQKFPRKGNFSEC